MQRLAIEITRLCCFKWRESEPENKKHGPTSNILCSPHQSELCASVRHCAVYWWTVKYRIKTVVKVFIQYVSALGPRDWEEAMESLRHPVQVVMLRESQHLGKDWPCQAFQSSCVQA